MPTVQFGKRPGRTRGRPENKATADGQAKIAYDPLPAVDGVDVVAEVQTVTTDGTGGTFTLTLGANESGNIAYNATIGAMETAIEGITGVTSATVTGSAGNWVVQFNDGLGPLGAMVPDDALLTGATTGTAVVVTTPGVLNVYEAFSLVTEGDTGSFTITIDGNTSAAIDKDDDADAIELLVEGITGITAVECSGTGTRKDPFIVTFATPAGNVAPATVTVSNWSSTVVAAARASAPNSDRE